MTAVIRPGRRPLHRIDHDEQLHDPIVDRRTGGLNDEHVVLADILIDAGEDVLVAEGEHVRRSEGDAQVVTYRLGEAGVGVSSKNRQWEITEQGVYLVQQSTPVQRRGARHATV